MKDLALMKKLNTAIPLGRKAPPEEIDSVVAFLASAAAGYSRFLLLSVKRWFVGYCRQVLRRVPFPLADNPPIGSSVF